MVILNELGSGGKNRALVRLFDVGFQRHQTIFARLVEQVVHHFQSIDVALLAEGRTFENSGDAADQSLNDMKRVGDEDRANGRATDDYQFGRLHQHSEVAVLHQIAGENGSKDDDDSNDGKQNLAPRASPGSGRKGERV